MWCTPIRRRSKFSIESVHFFFNLIVSALIRSVDWNVCSLHVCNTVRLEHFYSVMETYQNSIVRIVFIVQRRPPCPICGKFRTTWKNWLEQVADISFFTFALEWFLNKIRFSSERSLNDSNKQNFCTQSICIENEYTKRIECSVIIFFGSLLPVRVYYVFLYGIIATLFYILVRFIRNKVYNAFHLCMQDIKIYTKMTAAEI